jgi:hypothetical protein
MNLWPHLHETPIATKRLIFRSLVAASELVVVVVSSNFRPNMLGDTSTYQPSARRFMARRGTDGHAHPSSFMKRSFAAPTSIAQQGTRSKGPATSWHPDARQASLLRLLKRTSELEWSPALLRALIDELFVVDEFVSLLGEPADLTIDRYPQAVAIALALRHSWRRDDFRRLLRRLKLPTLTKA